jgi:hypothetical protein
MAIVDRTFWVDSGEEIYTMCHHRRKYKTESKVKGTLFTKTSHSVTCYSPAQNTHICIYTYICVCVFVCVCVCVCVCIYIYIYTHKYIDTFV